jgi:outer membrane protein insertion porin family
VIGRRATLVVLVMALALAACGGPRTPDPEGPGNKVPVAPVTPGKLEDLRGDLVAIEIVGLKFERTRDARAALTSTVGKPFELDRVAADVRALWKLGGVGDVHVEGRVIDGGVGLRFTVVEQAKIGTIQIQGATAFGADHLIEQLSLQRGSPVDPVAIAEARVALIDQYRQAGYAKAEVSWETAPHESGHDLVFTIVEGPPVVVSSITFKGNKTVNRDALLALIAKDGGPAIGGRYWSVGLEAGLLNISARYYDLGHINVAVRPPAITTGADGAVTIAVEIEEGDQFKLAAPKFTGTLLGTAKEYQTLLGAKAGEVFNRTKISEGIDRIRQMHASKGQSAVLVEPQTEIDAPKKRVKLTIVIK